MKPNNDTWIELVKTSFLKNKKVGLIPVMVYDMLAEENEIDLTEDEIQMLQEQTQQRMQAEAAKKGTRELKEFAHLKNSPLYPSIFDNEFKRQAVANYFTKQQEMENF